MGVVGSRGEGESIVDSGYIQSRIWDQGKERWVEPGPCDGGRPSHTAFPAIMDADVLFPRMAQVAQERDLRLLVIGGHAVKDLPDIVHLIRICQIDPQGAEFHKILQQYASDETRSLLEPFLRSP